MAQGQPSGQAIHMTIAKIATPFMIWPLKSHTHTSTIPLAMGDSMGGGWCQPQTGTCQEHQPVTEQHTHLVRCCLLEMMWNRFQDSYCCSFWATVLLFSHIILILSGIYKMVKFWQHICHIGFAWGNLWSSINSKVEIKNIYIASLFLCISQPGLAHTHTHTNPTCIEKLQW